MRAVRGVVALSKPASLAEAASFAAGFAVAAAAGEEARPDIAGYIRRFRSALDELVGLHREIDPHVGGEVESPSGGVKGEVGDVGGARVLGSEETRRMGRKKNKRKREEVDGERIGFDGGGGVGDLGHARRKKKKKKKEKKR